MDEPLLDRDLIAQTFLAEAEEILSGMEGVLVALEDRPEDDELLHQLFRAAHTLKGGAALAGFEGVRELAHALEDVLERLRGHALPVTDALVSLLLRSVDVLREAVAAQGAPTERVGQFRARLAAAAEAAASGAVSAGGPAAPAEGAPGQSGAGAAGVTPASPVARRNVRVALSRLDRLLDVVGELAVARGRLGAQLEHGGAARVEEALSAHRDADRLWLELQQLVLEARMVPVGPALHGLARVVRDVASACGKRARLAVEGEDVEVDASVVEHVRDPLNHMVRNAVDHGIEAPEVRAARGKDPCGLVTVRARHETGSIVIEVEDDGQGLDRARIAERARALGLATGAAGEEDVHRLVFAPGLSTSERVTEISGRGVGMDVVRRNVEALRGSVAIATTPGHGTTFSLRLPLSLAIIQGFRVSVAGDVHVVPLDAILECAALPRGAEAGTGLLPLRGEPLPVLRLRERFGMGGTAEGESVLVVRHGGARAGLVVDALLGECQAVVKPLGPALRGSHGLAGTSVLGDGRVAMVLDVPALLREAVEAASPHPNAGREEGRS